MSFSLLPTMIVHSLTDISPEMLRRRGIKLLMLDFDNTIVPYTTNIPEPLMEQWLYDMKQSDVKICVVSNSKRDRVRIFCKRYGIDCITHAKKPFPKGIRECLAKYGVDPSCAALVGDQIFTDVCAGKFNGMRAILVPPIKDKKNAFFKFKRALERPVLNYYFKKNGMKI